MSAEAKRLFIAVNLSIATTRKIAEAVEQLKKPARDGGMPLSWVPAPNLHVTLKFLGHVKMEAIETVRDATRQAAAEQRPFELRAVGIGGFPSLNRARVLWIGLKGVEPLAQLALRVDERLGALGFEKEARAYHAHLTIGRAREGASVAGNKLLSALAERDFGTTTIREVVLYESRLARAGAEYTALARLPLGTRREPRGTDVDQRAP